MKTPIAEIIIAKNILLPFTNEEGTKCWHVDSFGEYCKIIGRFTQFEQNSPSYGSLYINSPPLRFEELREWYDKTVHCMKRIALHELNENLEKYKDLPFTDIDLTKEQIDTAFEQ